MSQLASYGVVDDDLHDAMKLVVKPFCGSVRKPD